MRPRRRRNRCTAPHPWRALPFPGDWQAIGVLGTACIDGDVAAGLNNGVEVAAVYHQVFNNLEGQGPEGFNGNGITVFKMAHMQLTKGGSFFRTVGAAIDDAAAHTADAFAAGMVKSNGVLAFQRQLFVDHIQHFQKRHVC